MIEGDPLLELSAEDPDNSDLDFGVIGEFYNKLVEIRKIDGNRAVVILKQPFDREVRNGVMFCTSIYSEEK